MNGSTRQQTLSSLPGFYDVAVGENKRMYVKYEFRNRVFVMNIAEGEDFGMPQKRRLKGEMWLKRSIRLFLLSFLLLHTTVFWNREMTK